jgi:acetyl esterase/lipase
VSPSASSSPSSVSTPIRRLTRVISLLFISGVNYRKSIQPDAAFPGNLLDALSGYLYLVNELGFEPDKVVVMGDSAGGNTALGLARYLGELQKQQGESGTKEVGMVGGLILFSVSRVD